MTVITLLVAGRALIAEPGTWTQGSHAKDARGEPCDVESDDAVRWCAHGALDCAAMRAYGCPHETLIENFCKVPEYMEAREALYRVTKRQSSKRSTVPGLMQYNDHPFTTQADVLAVFDRAIRDERARLEVKAA